MSEQEKESAGLWDDAEIISVYTRAQALEDGVLVDITELARAAGFKFPVAATNGVWGVLEPSDELKAEGQDFNGRAWDMLTILRHAIQNAARSDTVHFTPLFVVKPGQSPDAVALYAKCGPDDDGAPTITIMRVGED